MVRRILFFYSIMLPFLGLAQDSKMGAEDYFRLANGIAYPDRYAYTTITAINYPKSNTYTDSGTTIIDHNQIYVQTKSETIVTGNIGSLNLNHEQKIALLSLSDSMMKEIVQKFPDQYKDDNDYSDIEPYLEKARHSLYTKEQEAFIRDHCDIVQKKTTDRVEINVLPRDKTSGYFISGRLVLNEQGRLLETETVYRDVYARDFSGGDKYRIVTQKNTNYQYTAVRSIPVQLNDFIEFKNWKIKLKKYTDYKLDVL
jgi:hypothetical protein